MMLRRRGIKFFFGAVLLRQRVLLLSSFRGYRVPRVLFHITLHAGGFLNQYPSAPIHIIHGAMLYSLMAARSERQYSVCVSDFWPVGEGRGMHTRGGCFTYQQRGC